MKKIREITGALRSLVTFTPAQVRGVVWLLPLLAVFGIIVGLANRPHFEQSFLELADSTAIREDKVFQARPRPVADSTHVAELFEFDPNTVTLQELRRLGFDVKTAAGIVKYRERGKRFEIPEDFAACYGVSAADYDRLEPYVKIGDEFRLRPRASGKPAIAKNDEGLKAFDPNLTDAAGFVSVGFSQKQAEVIVRYRNSIGGFRSIEDFARCYVVSDETMARLAPYIVFENAGGSEHAEATDSPTSEAFPTTEPIGLNGADSVALRSVNGIGEVLVARIMEYRDRLGGFANAAQLGEIRGMTEENLRHIVEQIHVDSCGIQKIDVNFAPHKTLVEQMGKHPYATREMLRKLLKNRQLKGGWSTIGEMVEQDILTKEEAERLSPYLLFRSE